MTICDIANLAGVSISTVSRVINKRKVSSSRKEKVLKIIQQQQYCPNTYAQHLGRRSRIRCGRKRILLKRLLAMTRST